MRELVKSFTNDKFQTLPISEFTDDNFTLGQMTEGSMKS